MPSYSIWVYRVGCDSILYSIPEFNGYFITKSGEVFSKKRKNLKLMVPKTDKDGYKYLGLYQGKVRKWRRVHILVALTFLPNPNKLPYVNHKDGVKYNNHVENLEWCTASYNVAYSFRVLGRKGNCYNRKPIKLQHKDSLEEYYFDSITECAYFLDITLIHLVRLLKGKNDISKSRKLKSYNIQVL